MSTDRKTIKMVGITAAIVLSLFAAVMMINKHVQARERQQSYMAWAQTQTNIWSADRVPLEYGQGICGRLKFAWYQDVITMTSWDVGDRAQVVVDKTHELLCPGVEVHYDPNTWMQP